MLSPNKASAETPGITVSGKFVDTITIVNVSNNEGGNLNWDLEQWATFRINATYDLAGKNVKAGDTTETTEAPKTTTTTTTEAPKTTTTTEGPSTVVTTENTTTTEEQPELPNTGTTNYNFLVLIASVLLVGAYTIVRKEVK